MADNKEIRGAQDRERINLNEDYEVKYWTERLGISAQELKQAVQSVGPMVKDVEKKIKSN
jgi:hypothetical protein